MKESAKGINNIGKRKLGSFPWGDWGKWNLSWNIQVQEHKAIFLACASIDLRVSLDILLDEDLYHLSIQLWQCSKHLPIRAWEQAAHSLIISTPHQHRCLRFRELRVVGWMAWLEPPTPHWHCVEWRKKRECCSTHTSKRKKHVACTHSCPIYLVTAEERPLLVAQTPEGKGC